MRSQSTLATHLAPLAPAWRLAVLMTALVIATTARAGDFHTPVSINIPAQTLAGALTALASQADLQILFPQELVAGLQAPAISGSYSAAEALQRLLAGAQLEFVMSGRDTVIIRALGTSMARSRRALRS